MAIVSEPSGIADVAAARLDRATLEANFSDLHPPLDAHEAKVEADRCYFCYDAPCQNACPTSIDIPLFIRQIAADNRLGAAKTILDANIMGGMCARVCPTETLCEEACVREAAEGKPVRIGLLQRHAVDAQMETGRTPFTRAAPTGKRVAIVGAGPAGLACAHALAVAGHDVVIFERREKSGGLNEYGIAAYKTPDDFAARETEFILSIGGISVKHGVAFGRDVSLEELRRDYDAVFLGVGLGATNKLGLSGEDALSNVIDAVDYIAELRQAEDLTKLAVGRRVVVIGGGMTAVDVAVQSKRLGAEAVTIAYRRGLDQMKASEFERELAQTSGVLIQPWVRPVAIEGQDGAASGVVFERTREENGALVADGGPFRLEADVVFTAIGQKSAPDGFADIKLARDGRIVVDTERRTSLPGVWAGGDCIAGGLDLTVSAVEDGKQAARSIDAVLKTQTKA
ncbi:MAG TPA: NAD(P)-dependent oxidoreductase [Roseiarcus sp.]|jgi:glutamate synthase (NADPH/NADH) small chain